MAGTSALTRIQKDNANENPVWERKIVFSFVSGDTAEVVQTININGIIQKIQVVVSGASGANPTAAIGVDDNNDIEIFSDSGLAEVSTTQYSLSEPVAGDIDIGITPSTDPLSAYSVTVYLRGI